MQPQTALPQGILASGDDKWMNIWPGHEQPLSCLFPVKYRASLERGWER